MVLQRYLPTDEEMEKIEGEKKVYIAIAKGVDDFSMESLKNGFWFNTVKDLKKAIEPWKFGYNIYEISAKRYEETNKE